MFKKLFIISILISDGLLFFNFAVSTASAQSGSEIVDQLTKSAGPEGANLAAPTDPRFIAMRAVQTLLGLVGLCLVGLLLYAGVLWITAGGNSEQTDKANKYIFNSVLGLILIIFSYTISLYIYQFAMGSQSSGCSTDRECGPRKKCNRYTQCVDELWCENNADCDQGEACRGNVCDTNNGPFNKSWW